MINTILAYDEKDVILGEFFNLCAIKTKVAINDGINLLEINSQSLNEVTIHLRTEALNSKPYLFITFTHGSESELLKNGSVPFLSTTINEKGLKNSLSYCFACHSGKELGHTLIENGSLAFVGYNKEVTVQKFFDALDSFVECATCGLKYFFNEMSLANSITLMKEKYTDCVDRFYSRDMIIASSFMENRDALILLGNKELTINDFYV